MILLQIYYSDAFKIIQIPFLVLFLNSIFSLYILCMTDIKFSSPKKNMYLTSNYLMMTLFFIFSFKKILFLIFNYFKINLKFELILPLG